MICFCFFRAPKFHFITAVLLMRWYPSCAIASSLVLTLIKALHAVSDHNSASSGEQHDSKPGRLLCCRLARTT